MKFLCYNILGLLFLLLRKEVLKVNLGQFIKLKRIEQNMTMEELGKCIGKNKTFISRLENNKVKTLKHEYIDPLANALNVPVSALFKNFDETGYEVKEVTPKEFAQEVVSLLGQTSGINDQEKALLLQTLKLICSDETNNNEN